MIDNTAISSTAAAGFGSGSSGSVDASSVALTLVRNTPAAQNSSPQSLANTTTTQAVEETSAAAAAKAAAKDAAAKDATEATEAADRPAKDETEEVKKLKLADFWRTRLDPESLRMFTEVIDPKTRDARYTIPPTMELSEEAQREGESLARAERLQREHGLIV